MIAIKIERPYKRRRRHLRWCDVIGRNTAVNMILWLIWLIRGHYGSFWLVRLYITVETQISKELKNNVIKALTTRHQYHRVPFNFLIFKTNCFVFDHLTTHCRRDFCFERICVLMLVSISSIDRSIDFFVIDCPCQPWERFSTQCHITSDFGGFWTSEVLRKHLRTTFFWTTYK